MSDSDPMLGAIELIYASALGEVPWERSLRAVGGVFHGRGVTLESHARRAQAMTFFDHADVPASGAAAYEAHFYSVCPRVAPHFRLPAGAVAHDESILSAEEIHDSEFYIDFLRPAGLKYFVSGLLFNDGLRHGVLSVQLPKDRGAVTDDEIARMGSLIPHLQRALKLHDLLASPEQPALEALELNVLFFDRTGRIVSMTRGADALLSSVSGLSVRGGLWARDANENAVLDRLVKDTATRRTGGGALRLTFSCQRALVLHVCPIARYEAARRFEVRPSAVGMVLVLDPSSRGAPTHVLENLYGLTPAEARVASALCRGLSPGEYAEAHGLEISTVRTHVLRIRSKTRTSSIGHLTSLLLRELWLVNS
ncbi:MAG: helix-turn-helix transcriptional regulator [Myxococcota bacterium]